jgi:hypothetical protein
LPKTDCALTSINIASARTLAWTLWLHTHCSPPSSIVRRKKVWSLLRPLLSRNTPMTTRSKYTIEMWFFLHNRPQLMTHVSSKHYGKPSIIMYLLYMIILLIAITIIICDIYCDI